MVTVFWAITSQVEEKKQYAIREAHSKRWQLAADVYVVQAVSAIGGQREGTTCAKVT